MSEPVYSPDGQHLWTGTTWVPVNNPATATLGPFFQDIATTGFVQNPLPHIQQNSNNISQIENLAKVMIDKLNRNDLKIAKECWNQAKMIDLLTTQHVFENQYASAISNGYLQIANYELNNFKQLYDNPNVVGIEFKVQVEMAPNNIELALNNSTAFVSQHNSFQYNLLYAKMWLYCRRFSLVWNRQECQINYDNYLAIARSLSKSSFDVEDLMALERMHSNQLESIKNDTVNLFFLTLLLGSICVILYSFL